MDESVVFVDQIREGDDDVLILGPPVQCPNETKNTAISSNQKPIAYVDLSRDSLQNQPEKHSDENKEKAPESSEYFLECAVCLENLRYKPIRVLHCGHLFCKNCTDLLTGTPRSKCPICRKLIIKKHIRPVYM
ncbi:E3 ubiquitin-protein ligase RNF125-like [Sitophilus oryzae]|uniref:E3 ubiquitin-protein ligase RNF125-like n=1 Tax=Sitophilus oryzae TaxID=7048 RepID=A0A6J2XUP7_SITOR|nr:E3 ubiquitin-protein ligase RNF125-like [Sitophilus oryzae]